MSGSSSPLLFLGPEASPLRQWLRDAGEDVIAVEAPIDAGFVVENRIAFLVSYGYRHILKSDVLSLLPGRAVNLHISYLPFNRGADPNLWSLLEDSPRGVSIHFLDEGIDTGAVIAQKRVEFDFAVDTLATSYAKLQIEIQQLFREIWPDLRAGRCRGTPQSGAGSVHRSKDRARVEHLLTQGWNTPISELLGQSR